eukprot:CAMPEP_0184244074 /NCGR_PEP_ID=MMETSP0977-20130417/659_1 /TAXON_ID=483370 /ORGANISM="non described non described, Strain CCMP2097" /LENGTH=175 /DNA_ID=CAMNT_0026549355 /DNA_START=148 /DNA_END=672 /DNA_ORIENTATION=+
MATLPGCTPKDGHAPTGTTETTASRTVPQQPPGGWKKPVGRRAWKAKQSSRRETGTETALEPAGAAAAEGFTGAAATWAKAGAAPMEAAGDGDPRASIGVFAAATEGGPPRVPGVAALERKGAFLTAGAFAEAPAAEAKSGAAAVKAADDGCPRVPIGVFAAAAADGPPRVPARA